MAVPDREIGASLPPQQAVTTDVDIAWAAQGGQALVAGATRCSEEEVGQAQADRLSLLRQSFSWLAVQPKRVWA
jgi:hypothetical protein